MKYLALRLPDLALLHPDVPLTGVVLSRGKNQAGEMTASLPKATAYEQIGVEHDGSTVELVREFGTLLLAVDGNMARSFVVQHADEDEIDQDRLTLQAFGHGSLPDDQPWTAEKEDYVEVDPLDIVRDIWSHLSSFADGLDVEVDDTTSPKTVGEEEREVDFSTSSGEDVAFDVGPFRLNWWSTSDLGKEIADLAVETPFEWREHTTMDIGSEDPPRFRIELGYPVIAPAERELRFEVGFNVVDPEQGSDDESTYFSEVLVLGQGEGSKKRKGTAARTNTGRLRRVKKIEDQGIGTNRLADQTAQEAVETADRPQKFWETITVLPTQATPPGSYDVGDIITVHGTTAWGEHTQRAQIIELTHTIADDTVTLTLGRPN